MIKVCKCKCVCRLFSFQSLLRMSIKAIHSSNNLCHFVRWFASFNALKPIILHDNLPHFISLFIINHIVTIKVLTYYSVWGVLLIACGWWGTSLPWLNDYIWKECSMYWVFLKNAGRLWGGWGLFISWIRVFSPAFYPNMPSIINHITPLSLRRGVVGEAFFSYKKKGAESNSAPFELYVSFVYFNLLSWDFTSAVTSLLKVSLI